MKKYFLLFVCVVLMTTILGGCKKSSKISTGEDSSGKVSDVNLVIWTAPDDEELIQIIANNFINEHSDEANISIEFVFRDEGDNRSAILSDVLNGPDVYTTTDGDIRVLAAGGGASKLVNTENVASENLESSVEAVTVEENMYGYPLTADNGYFLYYNKNYFSEEDVKSLDTMLDVAAASGKKVAMDWNSGWYTYSFFGMTGLTIGLNDDGVTNFCDWNSTQGAVTGSDIVSSMLSIGKNAGFSSMSQEKLYEGIKNGQVVACVSGIWDERIIKEAWGENYGASKLPEYKCGDDSIQMASFFGYKVVGVNPYSDNLEWAHKFAQYISNSENQKLRFEMRGQVPSNLEAAQMEEIQNSAAAQAVIAQSEYSQLQRIGNNYWAAMSTLANTLISGNPNNLGMQEIIDTTVEQITGQIIQ